MTSANDDDDTLVTIGTPLDPLAAGQSLIDRKPVKAEDQYVRDEQGRKRFHGAFTGGFSAGYFNTVGTKEGWTPASFQSSRKDRADKRKQTIEDFMDEEDISEFGIAPKRIAVAGDYATAPKDVPVPSRTTVSGRDTLRDIIVPTKLTIGMKLLTFLGWKPGQGVGPKGSRPIRNIDPGTIEEDDTESDLRVIGCALPPSAKLVTKEPTVNFEFAPDDICPINFETKDNMHGLGYKGLDQPTHLFSSKFDSDRPGFDPTAPTQSKQRGMSGAAFGVGALNDDDEDIYGVESMDRYDFALPMAHETEKERNQFQKRGPNEKENGKTTQRPFASVFDGFCQAKHSKVRPKVYPPPTLPSEFVPFHRFKVSIKDTLKSHWQTVLPDAKSAKQNTKLNAGSRAALLGDVNSVFQLIGADAKRNLENAKAQPGTKSRPEPGSETQGQGTTSTCSSEGSVMATSDDAHITEKLPKIADKVVPQFKAGAAFMPFASDASKQNRYDRYRDLVAKKVKHEEAYDQVVCAELTEWEKDRERDEFLRAAKLFQPLSFTIGSRFTQAKFTDDAVVDVATEFKQTQETDQQKAVRTKMYGSITREVFDWRPDKILCRRFNISVPYDSEMSHNLPSSGSKFKRKDDFSVFQLFSMYESSDTPFASPEAKPAPSTPAKPLKALTAKQAEPTSGKETILNDAEKPQVQPETDIVKRVEDLVMKEEKPPMDLFKAIFSESESEHESDVSDIESTPVPLLAKPADISPVEDDAGDSGERLQTSGLGHKMVDAEKSDRSIDYGGKLGNVDAIVKQKLGRNHSENLVDVVDLTNSAVDDVVEEVIEINSDTDKDESSLEMFGPEIPSSEFVDFSTTDRPTDHKGSDKASKKSNKHKHRSHKSRTHSEHKHRKHKKRKRSRDRQKHAHKSKKSDKHRDRHRKRNRKDPSSCDADSESESDSNDTHNLRPTETIKR